jgi:hypothetical protein
MRNSRDLRAAVLETREGTIPYLRMGRGSPVLVLRSGSPLELDGSDAVLQRLSESHRVFSAFVPWSEGPGGLEKGAFMAGPLERWIVSLIEGLGLHEPDVYLDPSLASTWGWIAERLDGIVGQMLVLEPVSVADSSPDSSGLRP